MMTMPKARLESVVGLGLLLLVLVSACSKDPGSGPVAVHWDRDVCERCRMVLSDPHFAAQIRYFPPGKRSRVAKFDDIGCALLWLDEQPWKNTMKSEIWVADFRTGEWLDARRASYEKVDNTPMEYGLGARPDKTPDSMDLEQAHAHVVEVEKRFNAHGLQLEQTLRKQAAKRQARENAR